MALYSRVLLLAGLQVVGLVSCSREERGPFEVKVAGCESWSGDSACVVGTAPLRVWVAGNETFAVELDGTTPILKPLPSSGGQRFELQVSSTDKKLRLVGSRRPAFELILAPSPKPPWSRDVADLAKRGELAAAEDLVARQPGNELPWKLFFQSRFAYSHGNRGEAARLARECAELWLAAKMPGYAIGDFLFASQMLADETRYAESRQSLDAASRILDSTASWPAEPVRLHFLVGHQRAILAHLTGDVRSSLASLDRLVYFRDECRLLSDQESSDLGQLTALVLDELGRFTEAAEMLDGLRSLKLDAASLADLDTNRGWTALLARQAGQQDQDPRPFFEAAWSYYSRSGLGRQKFNVQVNLAAAAVLDGRLEEADRHLLLALPFRQEAKATEKLMSDELQARLLLLRKQPQAALEKFNQLDIEAQLRHLPAASWQAQIGKAEAMAALGQRAAAADAFERAARIESRELLFIPLDKGRETFLAQREGTIRQHLDLLLADGKLQEAFDLVRRRRSQSLTLLRRDERLASLDPAQREDWDRAAEHYRRRQAELEQDADELADLPAGENRRAQAAGYSAELAAILDRSLAKLGLGDLSFAARPARPGELVLAFFPREGSWLVFAQDDRGHIDLEERNVPPGGDLESVAADLLARVAPQIHASRKLRILPWGDLDFHALPFEGRPLLATKPVVYGVDAGADLPDGRPPGALRAVLVGDPGSNLASSGKEIDFARKILSGQSGIELEEPLIGKDRALAPAVRAALERADYFHFAGHGEFSPEGSQSRLSLRGGDLKAGDVFTFKRVPDLVLLSSCSVGRSARALGVEGLGLANAFILAGSRQVVAATREVDDRDTAALIQALYENLFRSPGPIDLTMALQQAQIRFSQKNPARDSWKAFRAFEP